MSETSRLTPHRPSVPAETEMDLVGFALAVWSQKWVVLGAGVLCALVAIGVGLMTPPTYEATVRLLVTPPKTAVAGDITPQVSVATYRALVENQSLASKTIAEFKLGEPPFNQSVDEFIRNSLSVETLRDTNVIVVKVRLRDAQLAAKVANRLAALAVDLSQRLNQEEILRARDTIQTQVDHSRQRLDSLQAGLEAYRKKVQIELLEQDVEAVLGERNGLLRLMVDIQAEKARLQAAEEQLAKRSRVETVTRSIAGSPAMMEAARETAGGDKSVLGLQMKEESLSTVYEELETMAAASRTYLSGLEREKAELIDVRKLDSTALAQLSRLYEAETALARRTLEYDLAKKVYEDVATRLEAARLQVVGRSAQLQAMDDALPPSAPVSPRIVRNTAIAFAVGLALASLSALFFKVERAEAATRS
jgi:polysaccharide biosynthesis transport protein